jgi:hypothetical protein
MSTTEHIPLESSSRDYTIYYSSDESTVVADTKTSTIGKRVLPLHGAVSAKESPHFPSNRDFVEEWSLLDLENQRRIGVIPLADAIVAELPAKQISPFQRSADDELLKAAAHLFGDLFVGGSKFGVFHIFGINRSI